MAFYLCQEKDGRMVLRKTRRRSMVARIAGKTWQEARAAVDAQEFEHHPGHGYFRPGMAAEKTMHAALREAVRDALRVSPLGPDMAEYIAQFVDPFDSAVPAGAIGRR